MPTIRCAVLSVLLVPVLGGGVAGAATAPTHRQAAAQENRRLLDAVQLPPGTTGAAHAPVPALRVASQTPASSALLDTHRFWVVPGSADGLRAWLLAHPPHGLAITGQGNGSGPAGVVDSLVAYAKATPAYAEPALVLSVAADGPTHSALRADAQTIVLPDRTTAERVPAGVGSVDLVARRGTGMSIAHRVVQGAGARTIAAELDALQVFPPGSYSCPADSGFRFQATFAGPHGPIVATISPTGCASVSITSAGRAQPVLVSSPGLEHTLLGDLHLTRSAYRSPTTP